MARRYWSIVQGCVSAREMRSLMKSRQIFFVCLRGDLHQADGRLRPDLLLHSLHMLHPPPLRRSHVSQGLTSARRRFIRTTLSSMRLKSSGMRNILAGLLTRKTCVIVGTRRVLMEKNCDFKHFFCRFRHFRSPLILRLRCVRDCILLPPAGAI